MENRPERKDWSGLEQRINEVLAEEQAWLDDLKRAEEDEYTNEQLRLAEQNAITYDEAEVAIQAFHSRVCPQIDGSDS